MELARYLEFMVKNEGSDLFFSAGAPANIKIQGITRPLGQQVLTGPEIKTLAYSVIDDKQRATFEETLELNLAITLESQGRFRINLYRQRGEVAMVVRYIRTQIPTIEELQLPALLNEVVMEARGLVLVVGATGSGKSTTLAAMLDYRNRHRTGHILTIEDPIEFVHQHRKSVVDQREVGFDTLSYANALKNAMREAPDVIMIGEIRDRETMQHAMAYAETGHLCLSTLHANNANQAIERIINFFPDSAHKQLLLDLSLNLRAVISQRLIPGLDKKRVPAVEVMLRSAYIADLIAKREIEGIKEAIEQNREMGMQSFDQSLFELYKAGRIAEEEALMNADSRNNMSVKIRLGRGAGPSDDDSDLSLTGR